MKNHIKQMCVILSVALIMAVVIGCAGTNPSKSSSSDADSHFKMGMNAANSGDYDKAIAELSETIRLEPKYALGYATRGIVYKDKGEFDLAIADYEYALTLGLDNDAIRKELDDCKKERGERPQQPPATISGNPTAPAPAAKTAAADDELDVAIRDASDYLNDNIPKGSKIVILNIESNSANLSEYVIDELIANAVNDKNFSVVDRRQLEAIQSEQKFQMSGAVDDKDALAIGKFFGAQTIISGAMREIGSRYRLTIRALSVQTAQVQGQYNRNMAVSDLLTDLSTSGGSRPASVKTAQTTPAAATASRPAAPAEPPIQGTAVPGSSLSDKLAWLTRSADSHNTYIIEVDADETIAPYTFEYKGAINITIVLRGIGENRTIRLKSNGTLFTINDKVTFILDNNITLHGHNENTSELVNVNKGGIFKMNAGTTITGNQNKNSRTGGVISNGTFEMNGGTISNNSTSGGGGGGVHVYGGDFTMRDGIITGNSAREGGGVSGFGMFDRATFNMRGGIITGNTARVNGGGVAWGAGVFNKTGGTITGYKSDPDNGNAVKDEDGNEFARKGHAVWYKPPYSSTEARKETTAGPTANMSVGGSGGITGAWDN